MATKVPLNGARCIAATWPLHEHKYNLNVSPPPGVKMSPWDGQVRYSTGFLRYGFGYGLGKFGPGKLFKRYLKITSGTPDIGSGSGLNKFADPNFPNRIQNPISKNPVEYPPCQLRRHRDPEGLPHPHPLLSAGGVRPPDPFHGAASPNTLRLFQGGSAPQTPKPRGATY